SRYAMRLDSRPETSYMSYWNRIWKSVRWTCQRILSRHWTWIKRLPVFMTNCPTLIEKNMWIGLIRQRKKKPVQRGLEKQLRCSHREKKRSEVVLKTSLRIDSKARFFYNK